MTVVIVEWEPALVMATAADTPLTHPLPPFLSPPASQPLPLPEPASHSQRRACRETSEQRQSQSEPVGLSGWW
ncbi:hypothetical protein E2C01_085726 [Portunus trituberculatus]|uniref:Uncharacterized protein n=1 Tax=Portunus trituberculatus TaxID=210409 RepID=A0A5B7J7H5_PORTR|nr:hypothetical protein [Portunus trituberculatus]